ncbi:MAG: FAD-binding oxidoreductase, partial [Deltaproteobacteria bacterium]|nr:FAD-binding oxidoreductase [Deltaproteobacteria bacterium]
FEEVKHIEGFERIKAAYQAYLTDESKLACQPFDHLFFPDNEAQLAAVLREMARRRILVTIGGARTGLVGGCVPPQGALVSLERLNKIESIHYSPWAEEWRILAQAAVSLGDLNRMAMSKSFPDLEQSEDPAVQEDLARFKADQATYFYPPDPTEMSASLGGTAATNASGARTFRYGPTRAWIRGLRVMLANGEVLSIPRGKYFASASGRLVVYDSQGRAYPVQVPDYALPRTKNTAGLFSAPHMDLIDLFIGSEGALGVITAVEAALLPWSPQCSIVQFTASDDQALDLVVALRSDGRLRLDFLEFYSTRALDLLRRRQTEDLKAVGMPLLPDRGAAVFFELAFDPADRRPDFRALQEAVTKVGLSLEQSWAGYEPRELDRFKTFRHLLPETINAVIAQRKKDHPSLHKLGTDLAVPDERLKDMWRVYETELNRAGLDWVAFGHVGDNHLHINVLPRDPAQLEQSLDIYGRLASQAVDYGGTVSAEHGIGKIKAGFLKTMYTQDQLARMKAVKEALDPDGLLNPGNIFAPGEPL